jgi:TolB protein
MSGKGRDTMDRRLSGGYVILAAVAGVTLAAVLCIGLVVVLFIAGVGITHRGAERVVRMVDRIALIGMDGNLYLVDRNGENLEHIVVADENTLLAHPTWSPDGKRVAFVAYRETDGGIESTLHTVSAAGDTSQELYLSADNPPFYLYWSPDSQHISFLTQEDSGLALRLTAVSGKESPRVLERGSPFYWSWSPDGGEMLMHIGGARRLSDEARLAIINDRPESEPAVLDDAPANFQAPAWSPDGSQLLYAGEDEDGGQALFVRQRENGAVVRLVRVSGLVRFNWSPDGQWIAYQQIDDPRIAPLGDIFVIDVGENGEARDVRQVTLDPALAFFWSPDSQSLALLVPSLEGQGPSARHGGLAAPLPQEPGFQFRWWLVDVPTGELRPLAAFEPTRSFLLIVPYFDQYAQSIRFWSPDSRYLVYSHQESRQQAGIWVVDTVGEEPPHRLVDGTLGVWSWQ